MASATRSLAHALEAPGVSSEALDQDDEHLQRDVVRRRLLIVSPHFPPDTSAGTHRTRLLAACLPGSRRC